MKPLLLLHGAIGSSAQFGPLAERLSNNFKVYCPDLPGHGGREMPDAPFSIPLFANDVLRYMEQEQLEQVAVFGYSMGGYVAMYLALNHPEKVSKIVTLATKYHWDEAIAAKEVQMLNPDKMEQKVPAFANALQKTHSPNDWKQVLQKTTEMMTGLGRNNALSISDYHSITIPALLLLGDNDKMVTFEETIAVKNALPHAEMVVLPATPHPMDQVDIALLAKELERFL